jgi:hypothetical protein
MRRAVSTLVLIALAACAGREASPTESTAVRQIGSVGDGPADADAGDGAADASPDTK